MKRLTRALLSLYPHKWRDRYAVEFAALVEDTGGGSQHLFDIMYEAFKMRFSSVNWRYLGAFALAGAAIAAVVALNLQDRYWSQAVLKTEPGGAEQVSVMANELLSRTSLARIIMSPDLQLYKSERKKEPLEDVIEKMRSQDVRIVYAKGLIDIRYTGTSPVESRAVVRRLVTGFMDLHHDLQPLSVRPSPEADGRVSTLEIADPPSLPETPYFPNRSMVVSTGVLAGLGLALLALLIRRAPKLWLTVSLSALAVAGVAWVAPLPYDVRATVRFDSRATLEKLTVGTHPGVYLSSAGSPTSLVLRARNTDRFKAQMAVMAAVTRLVGASRQNSSAESRVASVNVVDPPSVPLEPLGAKWRERLTAASLFLAVLSESSSHSTAAERRLPCSTLESSAPTGRFLYVPGASAVPSTGPTEPATSLRTCFRQPVPAFRCRTWPVALRDGAPASATAYPQSGWRQSASIAAFPRGPADRRPPASIRDWEPDSHVRIRRELFARSLVRLRARGLPREESPSVSARRTPTADRDHARTTYARPRETRVQETRAPPAR
ncbi:MAG: lipopolysaccharide biosynthesis [Bryobacterales bacterium]|nr:lipopolysaccharide biosynthesis [Bryobacterales bacterium]